MSNEDVLRKIEIELREKIGKLEADIARLREAIEHVDPPQCQYPNLCKASNGHIEVCNYIAFQEWKRAALEPQKP